MYPDYKSRSRQNSNRKPQSVPIKSSGRTKKLVFNIEEQPFDQHYIAEGKTKIKRFHRGYRFNNY